MLCYSCLSLWYESFWLTIYLLLHGVFLSIAILQCTCTSRLKKSPSIQTDWHYKVRISVWEFHKTTKRSPIHRVELFLQHSSKSYYKHHKSHSTIYWSGEFIISKLATMQSFVNVASLQNLNIQRYSYVKRRFRKLCISFTMPKNITPFFVVTLSYFHTRP